MSLKVKYVIYEYEELFRKSRVSIERRKVRDDVCPEPVFECKTFDEAFEYAQKSIANCDYELVKCFGNQYVYTCVEVVREVWESSYDPIMEETTWELADECTMVRFDSLPDGLNMDADLWR